MRVMSEHLHSLVKCVFDLFTVEAFRFLIELVIIFVFWVFVVLRVALLISTRDVRDPTFLVSFSVFIWVRAFRRVWLTTLRGLLFILIITGIIWGTRWVWVFLSLLFLPLSSLRFRAAAGWRTFLIVDDWLSLQVSFFISKQIEDWHLKLVLSIILRFKVQRDVIGSRVLNSRPWHHDFWKSGDYGVG